MEEKINMKRILSLVLVLVMLLSTMAILTACPDSTPSDPPKTTTTTTSRWDTVIPNDPTKEYTYNTYMSSFPSSWNPHTFETSDQSEILDYTTGGFYTFDYNDDRTGFVVIPSMAAAMPKDVSDLYVSDKWNIKDGEANRAWRIQIREDLEWEDGTPIKAEDFYESLRRVLDPRALNHRADSYYSGSMTIVGAKDYYYSGRLVKDSYALIETAKDPYYRVEDFQKRDNGQLTPDGEFDLYFNVDDGCSWSSNSLQDYYYAGYLFVTDENGNLVKDGNGNYVKSDACLQFEEILAAADDEGWVNVDAKFAGYLMNIVAYLQVAGTPDEYSAYLEANGSDPDYAYVEWNEFCYLGKTWPEFKFEDVGFVLVDEHNIDIILTSPLSGFYLNYSLTGDFSLVNIDLYDSCASYDALTGIYTNTYGTSVDTYMSFGPYKLTSFQADKQFVLERNDNWFGYNDCAPGAGWYQTTKVVYDWINDNNTAMEAFLQGKLDGKGLDVNTIEKYSGSGRIYYTDGSSTWFIAMNPNLSKFQEWEKTHPGYNKSVLTIKEFRMALSFSLDRKSFLLACDPTGSVALGCFNDMICSRPDEGIMYRQEEQAKDVLLDFWGISQDDIGEGKFYADKDDAIDSITGYNLTRAKQLFNEAYDTAVAQGIYNGEDKIHIIVGIPSSYSFYTNGYEFFKNCWSEAVKGTKFEGKIELAQDTTIDGNTFGNSLRNNQTDLLFGVGFSGSPLDPYGLVEVYTTPGYQYNTVWNTKSDNIVVDINGTNYVASVYDWTMALGGEKITITPCDAEGNATGDPKTYSCGSGTEGVTTDERLAVLAALEGATLERYELLPLSNQSSASLLGLQVEYGQKEYVYGVGRGGIQYMTYNYDDTEWDAYVKSLGGIIKYEDITE